MNQLTVYFCPQRRRFAHAPPPDGNHYQIIHRPTEDGCGLELEIRHSNNPNSIKITLDGQGMVVSSPNELRFHRSGQVIKISRRAAGR